MATINDKIRDQIRAAGATWVSVDAVLKDGTVRNFFFNPRQLGNELSKKLALSEPHVRAAETTARRYPDLFKIWDRSKAKFEKYAAEHEAKWRAENPGEVYPGYPGAEASFHLDNVLEVRAKGKPVRYRVPNPMARKAVPVLDGPDGRG